MLSLTSRQLQLIPTETNFHSGEKKLKGPLKLNKPLLQHDRLHSAVSSVSSRKFQTLVFFTEVRLDTLFPSQSSVLLNKQTKFWPFWFIERGQCTLMNIDVNMPDSAKRLFFYL